GDSVPIAGLFPALTPHARRSVSCPVVVFCSEAPRPDTLCGPVEVSPSPVYGAALLMRFGFIAHRGFKSLHLRRSAKPQALVLGALSVVQSARLLADVLVRGAHLDRPRPAPRRERRGERHRRKWLEA